VIAARLIGFSAHSVVLHAKYQGALKWDEVPMRPQPNGSGYQLLFAGLSDSLEYYVQADDAQSKRFVVRVKDLPAVKRLRVAVHYPASTGLKDAIDDPGGDIRAVEGSQAEVSVLTDKPLEHGLLVFENGSRIALGAGEGNWSRATLPIKKDGSYHIAALDNGEAVRVTDDYFIEAKKDEPPSVRILQPGRDPHVSPIEEVPVTVDVADDFGVHDVDLHYSVNGGAEQVRPLLKGKNVKEAQGKTLLSFEDFKLAPGDLVSFYATARDGEHTSRSDIVFAQAEPFDFKFRQSQQAGGGGGGEGDQSNNISERQKEIIAATWNQMKDGAKERGALEQNEQFLSSMENKLGEQAKALAERMGNRELAGANPEFEEFSKAMLKASDDMSKAVGQLGTGKWNDALPPEQQALQSLLHAESLFREIQVAFGQRGGGGMGASGQERELARLFDLELDTSKNQYETGQSATPPGQDQQKQIDDALQRLKELARRQQELAEQQHSQQQEFQQRWEQEQLRREAEQLRQQMQQLSQNSQGQSGQAQESAQSAQSSGQSQSGQQGGRAQSGRNRESMHQGMDALRRAEDEMRSAVSNHDSTAQRRAAGELAQAQSQLNDMLHQQAGNSVSDLAEKAKELAARQRDLGNRVKDLYGAGGINTLRPNQTAGGESAGAQEMPEMNGPDFAGRWRRRYLQSPGQPATGKEKALASEGERLSKQMEQLQQQMQQQAQRLGGEQPDATRKLRKALSDAEQQELAVRMQKNSDWLRGGYGSQVWPMEDSITAGTDQLTRGLQEAQQALNDGKSAAGSSEDAQMAQALAEVRSLREKLESQVRQSPQNGDGKPSIGGDVRPGDAIQNLNGLRSQLGRNDRQLNGYLIEAVGSLRQVNAQAGLLDARLSQDAIANLGRLELELARRLGQGNADARTGTPENAPENYRQAVADYFRMLSK
jgi:hypothetical protein